MNPIEQQMHERLDKIIAAHLPRATDQLGPSTQSAFVVLLAMTQQARMLGL